MPRRGLPLTLSIVAGLLTGTMALPVVQFIPPAMAQDVRVSVNIFFDQLQPHGLWVSNARYNYVWCPRVSADWRPYTQGHWLYIRDRGWYFQSEEPFAWAVYHYGRWIDDNDLGWCWVPGTHWAPAWVSWRRSRDYVGWAPLPPDNDGFAIDLNISGPEPPQRDWVFVPVRSFVEPQLSVSIVFGDRDPQAYKDSTYLGPVTIKNDTVIHNIISLDFIKQETGHEVKVVDTKPVQDPSQTMTAPAEGAAISVFTPALEPPKGNEAPPQVADPGKAKSELARERPPKGVAPGDQQPAPSTGAAAPAGAAPPAGTAPAAPVTPASPAPTTAPGATTPGGPATPAGAAPAAPPPAATCPKGQELVDAKCVPAKQHGQKAAPAKGAPTTDQAPGAAGTAPPANQPKPTPGTAPAGTLAAPTDQQLKCAADQQAVDGKCVPLPKSHTKPPERPAKSQDQSPNAQVAPTDQSNPAPDQGKPVKCKPGFELLKNKCVPVPGAAAPAQ